MTSTPPQDVPTNDGVRLDLPANGRTVVGAAAANAALAAFGTRLWPIDLTAASDDVRSLLRRPELTAAESALVRDTFLLSRARLLEIIAAAGRTPTVPGGGELSTLDVANNVVYPQLYIVERDVDYSRFDRLHENISDNGISIDEVMSILAGGGVRLVQRLPDATEATLHLSCVGDSAG